MPTDVSRLLLALRKRVGFEVVSHAESPNQLRILGRILTDNLGMNSNNWKIVKYRLLTAMDNREWKVDISKSYFIKKETKKLVFAWRILLQGTDVAKHYADVSNIIETSPSAQPDVTEIPIHGGADRNNTAGGRRGAGPSGSVAVGPAAVQRKLAGG